MRVLIEDLKDEQQIEHLIKQRQIVKRILMLLKQIREDRSPSCSSRISSNALDILLESYQFYVYRTDNQQVLARGIKGFDAAKDKANQLRKSLNLKWDQVSFKADRGSGAAAHQSNLGNPAGRSRVDYANRVNPSKRLRFRGYTDAKGNYHDID